MPLRLLIRTPRRSIARGALPALLLVGSSCAPESYEHEADEEVYEIVADLEEEHFGPPPDAFQIDRRQDTLRDRLFSDLEDGAIPPSRATESIIVPKAEARSGAAEEAESVPPPTGDAPLMPPPAAELPSEIGGERPPEEGGGGGDGGSEPLATLLGEDDDEPAVLAVAGPAAKSAGEEAPQAPRDFVNEAGVVEIDLHRTLEIAFENSRDYQTRKENVYVAALNLTRQRFNFGLQWFDRGDGGVAGVEGDTGNATADNEFGVDKFFEFGGSLGLSILTSFSRIIVQDDEWSFGNALSASFTTPIMRGFGYWIAREPLTQAERDSLYAVREFRRFQRTFTVSIASQFLRVLQQKANLRNALENLESLRLNADRQREFHEAGRIDIVQLGQAAQDELSAEQRVVTASAALDSALDQLKLTLGVPTVARFAVLERDLEKLSEQIAEVFTPDEELCIQLARTLRQDLMVTRGRVVDADRQVNIAANALQMGLDLSLSTSVPTDDRQPFDFNFEQTRYAAGLAWDLPIQRLPERNTYRRSLITREQARRAYEQARDQVDLEVRRGLRNLEQARLSYDIQRSALQLAGKRVDSARDRQAAGRATVRDFLESQRDLLTAQDATYAALIAYVIAQLELVRDLEILEINVGDATFDARLDRLANP
ncbi:MAG: TolC family protein [Planctomycetes bacterium]|nr:TolC family protein [Planctomycetota bacterium]